MTNDKKLCVAVIGCGYWGKNLVKNFAALGVLGTVFDLHEPTAQTFSRQYNVPLMAWNEILASSLIDAVVIAAPAVLHAKLALEALDAGKHVYIEKPLALSVEEGKKVIQKASEVKRVLMVGHILNYHPAFVKLKELVVDGVLGKIDYIQSSRLSLGKVRHEENVLWSFAPHDISMILALIDKEPQSVQAVSTNILQKDIADISLLTMDFADGMKAHIHASWVHPFKEQRLIVIGDKAMAVFDDIKPWTEKLALYSHKIDVHVSPPVMHKEEVVYIPLKEDEPLRIECRHFIDAIKEGYQPLTDGNEGLRVLKVLEQASNSVTT